MQKLRRDPVWAVIVSAGVLFLLIIGGCHQGPPLISIEDAQASLSPAIYGDAMATMKIVNKGGADVLTGVRVDVPGATAALHVMEGQRMVRMESLRVPHGTLALTMATGHIMIENMPRDTKAGTPIALTLVFQKSGERQLHLTLQKPMPMTMPMEHEHHP